MTRFIDCAVAACTGTPSALLFFVHRRGWIWQQQRRRPTGDKGFNFPPPSSFFSSSTPSYPFSSMPPLLLSLTFYDLFLAKVNAGSRHFGISLAITISGNPSPNSSHRYHRHRIASVAKESAWEDFSWVGIMEFWISAALGSWSWSFLSW